MYIHIHTGKRTSETESSASCVLCTHRLSQSVCAFECVCVCMCVHMCYADIVCHIHTYIHTWIHATHMHTHTYIHTWIHALLVKRQERLHNMCMWNLRAFVCVCVCVHMCWKCSCLFTTCAQYQRWYLPTICACDSSVSIYWRAHTNASANLCVHWACVCVCVHMYYADIVRPW